MELEQQKKQLETKIESLLKVSDYEGAKTVSADLEAVVDKMQKIG